MTNKDLLLVLLGIGFLLMGVVCGHDLWTPFPAAQEYKIEGLIVNVTQADKDLQLVEFSDGRVVRMKIGTFTIQKNHPILITYDGFNNVKKVEVP